VPTRREDLSQQIGAGVEAREGKEAGGLSLRRGLAGVGPRFADDWAVTVVLASAGYPESSSKGDPITGLDRIPAGVEVTHAGTARNDAGEIVTAGGRVLNLTGLGPGAAEARERAYEAAQVIDFAGKQMRTDIAARAVVAPTG